jgi:RimJ/RimL family protein N-acetyltransferase
MELRVESPFPEHAVPRIWVWVQDFRSRVADDFAPKDLPGFMAEWAQRQAAGQQTWAVYRDGEIGGLVTFDPWSPVVGSTHCLFSRRFWGHETTVPALREAYRQIFETNGTRKLLAFAFADNYQLLGVAKKLGARREGLLRHQTMRGGRPVDMIAIGLLREDFDVFSSAICTSADHSRRCDSGQPTEPEGCPDHRDQAEHNERQHGDDQPGIAA